MLTTVMEMVISPLLETLRGTTTPKTMTTLNKEIVETIIRANLIATTTLKIRIIRASLTATKIPKLLQ